MRLIGHLREEAGARAFGDFLFAQGIDNRLENQAGEGWAVWVMDEDRLEQAGRMLTDFQKAPQDPKYRASSEAAAQKRAEREKEQAQYRKRVAGRQRIFRPITAYGIGPLSLALMAACSAVFIFSDFGQKLDSLESLFLLMPEVRQGELWRLVTPVLIHFSWAHIIFNLWWLMDLGSMIESRQSSFHLAALVLVIAAGSDLAQYYFSGPLFGGMSGVVYGLFGYIWVRGKFDPASGLFLHPTTVLMMIIWFFLCLLNLVAHVANAAHGAGLLLGMAWGYLASLRRL